MGAEGRVLVPPAHGCGAVSTGTLPFPHDRGAAELAWYPETWSVSLQARGNSSVLERRAFCFHVSGQQRDAVVNSPIFQPNDGGAQYTSFCFYSSTDSEAVVR